jgi:polar amino acid transport system substrate-binding protein
VARQCERVSLGEWLEFWQAVHSGWKAARRRRGRRGIRRRRPLLVGAVGALLLPVVACAGPAPVTSSSPYRLISRDAITAATQLEQPPFAMADDAGNPTGFAVELMNEAARRLGVRVEYKLTNLQGILTGLTAGVYDIGVAGIGATEERRREVDFTIPFYWGFTAVVTTTASTASALWEFSGRRVGVVSGSVQERFVAERMPASEMVEFRDQTALIGRLLSGGVDAVVLGGADALEYVERQPVRIAYEQDSLQGSAFALPKNGDPQLLADIDAQIDAMIEDGTYLTLYRKYFTHPVAAGLLTVRPNLAAKVEGTDLAPRAD